MALIWYQDLIISYIYRYNFFSLEMQPTKNRCCYWLLLTNKIIVRTTAIIQDNDIYFIDDIIIINLSKSVSKKLNID